MDGVLTGLRGFRLERVVFAVFWIWLIVGSRTAFPQTAQAKPWEVLQAGLHEDNTNKRAAAVAALGLVQDDPRAIEYAENALGDNKPAVRSAAATALGQMGAQSSIPLLKNALSDKDNRVFFAAADSLLILGDPVGYDVYYEVLTGERKSGESWIVDKKRLMTDERAMVLLGLGVGIGFAPYAGYGWMIVRELSKDYVTPVRINALSKLANDPDSRIGEALVKAASDKHWIVRKAALAAMARHGDPSLISSITPYMEDKKAPVRYTAAAGVLRLSALIPTDETAKKVASQ